MKNLLALPLALLLGAPATAQLQPEAPPDLPTSPQLPVPRPTALPDAIRLWLKVRVSVTIEELATALNLDTALLARLNDVDEDHQFQPGDWLVLPSQSSRAVKQLAAVDTSQLRRTPPLESLPKSQEPARVRFGDNLVKIAQRYNLTLAELLRLNPGLVYGRLVVGTQIRTAQSTRADSQPGIPLVPSATSGWLGPEPPNFGPTPALSPAPTGAPPDRAQFGGAPPPQRFDHSLDELVRQGILSPGELDRIRRGGDLGTLDTGAFQQACKSGVLSPGECRGGLAISWGRRPGSAPVAKPLSAREQALLQRIRQGDYTPQWRTYGQCNYDWTGWRLHANGTRTTAADCGGTTQRWQIGVSCDRLLVSVRSRDGSWGKWETPSGPESKFRQGEDQMVAALCANVKGS